MTPINHPGRILIWLALLVTALLPPVAMLAVLWQYFMQGQMQLIETLLRHIRIEVLLIASFGLTMLPWYVLVVIFIQRDRAGIICDPQLPTELEVNAK